MSYDVAYPELGLITIVYEKKNIETYQVQDNHLIMMDEYKNPDENYALARQ